ncbi:MAG: glycosyltransferase family 39 protein [Candidatus Omnitrophica bacterium]|nr:glycosyltransferase family 39 protein [Candidatus Omnitrophota bacterium]
MLFYNNGQMLSNNFYAADESSYDQIAINFLQGKGMVTDDGLYARRVPVYPFFLSVVYLFYGHSLVAARFVQAILGALTSIFVYLICNDLINKRAAVFAAVFSALYYPFIVQPAYLLTEVLFSLILLCSLYFLNKFYAKRRSFDLFLFVSLLGIAVLTKDVLFYFAIIAFFWIAAVSIQSKSIVKHLSLFVFSFLLVMLPWLVRNFIIYKEIIPTSVGSGLTLYYGNNPKATGGSGGWYRNGVDAFLPDSVNKPIFSPGYDSECRSIAVKWIKNNPGKFIKLSFAKFMNMWRPFYSDARIINKIVMSISYLPIILLAVFGILVSYNLRERLWPLYLLLGYFVLVHMATIAEIRYRYPVMYIVIIFSALAMDKIMVLMGKKRC